MDNDRAAFRCHLPSGPATCRFIELHALRSMTDAPTCCTAWTMSPNLFTSCRAAPSAPLTQAATATRPSLLQCPSVAAQVRRVTLHASWANDDVCEGCAAPTAAAPGLSCNAKLLFAMSLMLTDKRVMHPLTLLSSAAGCQVQYLAGRELMGGYRRPLCCLGYDAAAGRFC